MTLVYAERGSDSPYIQMLTHGFTQTDGSTIRPAEMNWHMVVVKEQGDMRLILTGPWATSGIASWQAGAEVIWIRFKLGVFMPHLPTNKLLNAETPLPDASNKSFWLNSCTWQFPDIENVDTFIARLIDDEVLVCDSIVNATLQDQPQDVSDRTLRHRFLKSTGLSQNYIRQYERAQQAVNLLQQGVSILDVVYQADYYDQPHLTRSLKKFIGYTPAQFAQLCTL